MLHDDDKDVARSTFIENKKDTDELLWPKCYKQESF